MIGKVGGWGRNPQKSGSFRRGDSTEAEKAADFKVHSEVICQQRPRGGEAHALEAGDCRKSSPGRMDGGC